MLSFLICFSPLQHPTMLFLCVCCSLFICSCPLPLPTAGSNPRKASVLFLSDICFFLLACCFLLFVSTLLLFVLFPVLFLFLYSCCQNSVPPRLSAEGSGVRKVIRRLCWLLLLRQFIATLPSAPLGPGGSNRFMLRHGYTVPPAHSSIKQALSRSSALRCFR